MWTIILCISMEVLRSLRTVDGATLGYRLYREPATTRRLIVLLHGVASNMTRWSEFVEQTILTKSWDVLRPDLRGHGESFSRGTLNLEIWCKDLRDILDAEGYDQALLIGHSLGAQVAIQFAARYPARVTALAIIDPVFHVALRGGLRVMARLRFIFRILTECIRLLNKIGLRRRTIPARDLQQLDRETRKNLLDTGKKREMIELYSSPWQDFRFFPIASYLKELLEITRPLPALEKINAPILALLSSGITYTDPGITRRILDGHPRSETVTVAAHHWPLTENPEQVRSTIEQWCARLPI